MASLDGRSARGFLLGCVFCAPWGILGYYRPWSAQGEVGRLPPGEVSSTHSRTGNDARAVPDASGRAAPSAALRRPPHWPSPADPGYVGFDPPEIHLGETDWGTRIPIELNFVNRGDDSVRITSVRTSCGCTTLQREHDDATDVAPSAVLGIAVTLDTEHDPGLKRRSVMVGTADGRSFTAAITVDVMASFELHPQSIDFGDVSVDSEGPEPSRVLAFRSATHALRGRPTSDIDWVNLVTADRGIGATDILVTIRRDRIPPGVQAGNVIVTSTDTRVQPVRVPIRVRTLQSLVSDPGYVYLRGTSPSIVTFYLKDGSKAMIVEANSSNPAVQIALAPDGQVRLLSTGTVVTKEPVIVSVLSQCGTKGRVLAATFPE